MQSLSAVALSLLISLGSAAYVNAAPQFNVGRDRAQNRDRVCFYQDIQYQGWEQCYNAGDEVPTLGRRNNAISSIRIYGRARVTIYEDTEFRGRSAEFSSSVPDLGLRNLSGSRSWSDHVSSFRISSDYASGGNNAPIFDRPNARTNDGICVYDRPDYEGRERCWDSGADVVDLDRAGNWSDRISSIRVFGRASAVLYRDVNHNGGSITIDRDVPDLRQISGSGFRNWDRQVSSLIVESDRRGFFPGRGRGRGRF